MNNPIRKWLLKHLEFSIFDQLITKAQLNLGGKRLLDLACGSGYSSLLLEQRYQPTHVVAFDLMEKQIKLAGRYPTISTDRFIGDITALGLRSNVFDVAFGFGILHHIKGWKQGVREIARVLKPGGYLVIEEPNGFSAEFFRRFVRYQIPKEGHFTFTELEDQFQSAGLQIINFKSVLLPCFRAYLLQKL